MSHVRTRLREAVRTAIIDGVTGITAQTVYLGRNYPIDLSTGPAIAVHAFAAQSTPASQDDLDRTIELGVTIMISGGDDFEDRLDAMAAHVEAALETSADVRAVSHDIWLASEEFDLEADADTRVARLHMNFLARVLTPRGNPQTLS
jgi:hypothetical protein